MESTAVQPAKEKFVSRAVVSGQERPAPHKSAPDAMPSQNSKSIGYGLPCSRCRAYYPADMTACPICKSAERVSPTAAPARPVTPVTAQPETSTQVDNDRERFLKELKSQAFASHTQINAYATFRCVLEHQHNGSSEPAAVCHTCYTELKQLADRLEAALHMDTQEAAKIVYEAVWADTSDPNKTYQNAAASLLGELRKRAGIGLLLGPNQPRAH
jgi:hypothetical protein